MPIERAIAINIIKSMVPLGVSTGKVISILNQLNVSYRRTDMLTDIRKAFDRVKYEEQIGSLKGNQVVPEGWMSHEKLGMPYNYRVHLKVDYYNKETGEYETLHRYMFQDDLKKIDDWKADFPEYGSKGENYPELEYMDSRVAGVTKNIFEEVPF